MNRQRQPQPRQRHQRTSIQFRSCHSPHKHHRVCIYKHRIHHAPRRELNHRRLYCIARPITIRHFALNRPKLITIVEENQRVSLRKFPGRNNHHRGVLYVYNLVGVLFQQFHVFGYLALTSAILAVIAVAASPPFHIASSWSASDGYSARRSA